MGLEYSNIYDVNFRGLGPIVLPGPEEFTGIHSFLNQLGSAGNDIPPEILVNITQTTSWAAAVNGLSIDTRTQYPQQIAQIQNIMTDYESACKIGFWRDPFKQFEFSQFIQERKFNLPLSNFDFFHIMEELIGIVYGLSISNNNSIPDNGHSSDLQPFFTTNDGLIANNFHLGGDGVYPNLILQMPLSRGVNFAKRNR